MLPEAEGMPQWWRDLCQVKMACQCEAALHGWHRGVKQGRLGAPGQRVHFARPAKQVHKLSRVGVLQCACRS